MMQVPTQALGHGITLIDVQIGRPNVVAAYLLQQGDRAVFIDTGATRSVPALLQVLENQGVERGRVDYVIPTHVHLDHGGGAGALLEYLPEAQLIVHPLGARHMIDPTKLNAGATAVYGEEVMQRVFGDLVPVPEERVIIAEDGFEVDWQGRLLKFLDTPGHARHHFSVVDAASDGVFTGDAFGLSYREFDTDETGNFGLPTSSPIQFDPEAMHASVDKIINAGQRYCYVTHFGRVQDVKRIQGNLHELIDIYVQTAAVYAEQAAEGHQALSAALMDIILDRAVQHGCDMPRDIMADLLQMDMDLNAMGLIK